MWLTGLPAAGKSTIAGALQSRLVNDGRPAYVLDGDDLRHGLSGDLGFSPSDRHENIRRTAHVAALLADAGLVAVVALISPYRRDRKRARDIHVAARLPFIEAFIDTPIGECERRDPKGLFGRARRGELKDLTGVDAPYEPPESAELVLRTLEESLEDMVGRVLAALAACIGPHTYDGDLVAPGPASP